MLNMQRLAADFLSNYVYLTVGKVGSSTDLITQKVVDVSNLDKRRYLIDILRSQGMNAVNGVVLLIAVSYFYFNQGDILNHFS